MWRSIAIFTPEPCKTQSYRLWYHLEKLQLVQLLKMSELGTHHIQQQQQSPDAFMSVNL